MFNPISGKTWIKPIPIRSGRGTTAVTVPPCKAEEIESGHERIKPPAKTEHRRGNLLICIFYRVILSGFCLKYKALFTM